MASPLLPRLTGLALLVSAASVLVPAACGGSSASTAGATSGTTTGGMGGSPATTASTGTNATTGTASTGSGSFCPAQAANPVHISVTGTIDTTFAVANHMFASGEMQLSGEPLAESMGRVLADYSRDYQTSDVYFAQVGMEQPFDGGICMAPGTGGGTGMGGAGGAICQPPAAPPCFALDMVGFATAVESYEYSKQPMNNLALESGAGVSLAFGPLENPTGLEGAPLLAALIPRYQHFATGSNATASFVHPVDGTDPMNRLGWPGLWPTMHPYTSFDPTINAVNTTAEMCSISSDDDPNATGRILNLDYECDYNSLHLPNRTAQLTTSISPGASGWAGWKYSLWVMNYLQSMHDTAQNPIASVPAGQLGNVGTQGDTILGTPQPPASSVPGTYLGSSDIEGFQAQIMIDGLDNAAQQWLTQLTTTDGKTLSGFASIKDAMSYDYASPLRWFPGAINVTEAADASSFPRPTAYAISDSGSHLFDLFGLVNAYSDMFALTDPHNGAVGGSPPALAYFDGNPFPAYDPTVIGGASLHDRALGMLRVLLVNLNRLHRDPASGVLVDDVTFTNGKPVRGATVSTQSVAYTLVTLRTLKRTLSSQLQLYSNNNPDAQLASSALDAVPLSGAPASAKYCADRINALLTTHAQLLLNSLTTAAGKAVPGWDVTKGAPSSTDNVVDWYAAAIRGLLSAYDATGDTTYRDRAEAVFDHMDQTFYDCSGRIYTSSPVPQSTVSYTPVRFALIEASLREMYEQVGNQPGQGALGALLQDRIARLIKLVLNGWDDFNQDEIPEVNKYGASSECMNIVDGIPRGGLQMAERALSGELGDVCDSILACQCPAGTYKEYTFDREGDCVPEISAVHLPSALANQITFKIGN